MALATLSPELSLIPRATYVKELKPELPAHVFERAGSRLAFIPAYFAVAVTAMLAIARGWVPWLLVPVMSIVIGMSFAGMTFVGHELLHGAIVRNRRLQYAIGWLAFSMFTVSPRLWIGWHNATHHGSANLADDPDAYPTLEEYRSRGGARFSIDYFSLGARRWRGVLSLLLGFTGQSTHQLLIARQRGFLRPREHRLAIAETLLGLAAWAAVAVLVGPLAFVFVFVVPLLVANACVMAFILTNHSLSPRVAINDPLASGLSVTTPRIIEWLTLGFGYHVEHHLFPAMSTRHASTLRAHVAARWPTRYQSMSLVAALRALHRGARVYLAPTMLHDPRTGSVHPTLQPGE